jgi:hypothetical protein
LLAKASCPPAHSALTHRIRQQAGSYKGCVVPFHVLIAATPSVAGGIPTLCVGTINIAACIEMARTCGTGFSRESVGSHTTKDVVCQGLFPAEDGPTMTLTRGRFSV